MTTYKIADAFKNTAVFLVQATEASIADYTAHGDIEAAWAAEQGESWVAEHEGGIEAAKAEFVRSLQAYSAGDVLHMADEGHGFPLELGFVVEADFTSVSDVKAENKKESLAENTRLLASDFVEVITRTEGKYVGRFAWMVRMDTRTHDFSIEPSEREYTGYFKTHEAAMRQGVEAVRKQHPKLWDDCKKEAREGIKYRASQKR